MKIVLTFDSFDEFQDQVNGYAARLAGMKAKKTLVPLEAVAESCKKLQEKLTAPAPEPVAVTHENVPDPEPAPAEAPAADEKPDIDEKSYRLEVRRVLSKLNKMEGHKGEAVELIKTFGVSRMDDVALADLPALKKKAEEIINA